MKAGDAFQVDAAWWKKNKPVMLKPTGLGKALTDFAAAKAAFMAAKADDKKLNTALSKLDAVDKARLKGITLCGNDHPKTKTALQKADAIDNERDAIVQAYGQRYVAYKRQLTTRLADLKRWNASLDTKIAKYQAEKDTYDDKKLKALEKDFSLISSKYLPDAITGAKSADDEFRKHSAALKAHLPTVWADYAAIRDEVADEANQAQALKQRAQSVFPFQDL